MPTRTTQKLIQEVIERSRVIPSPINASLDKNGLRFYEFNGQKLMSATSLRRVLGMSFGLHNWAVSQTINAATSMRGNLAASAMTDEEFKKHLRKTSMTKRDEAASLGTSIHEAAENGVVANDLGPNDVRKPFLIQYEKAQRELGFTVVATEMQVFNLTLGYAGSLDAIFRMPDGRFILVDYKTGKGIYNDTALQLALYFGAEFAGGYDPIDNKDVEYPHLTELLKKTESTAILHLRPDEWEYVPIPVTDELAAAAVDLTNMARWFTNHPTLDTLRGTL